MNRKEAKPCSPLGEDQISDSSKSEATQALLAHLAQIRGFVMEHELPDKATSTGDVTVNVVSPGGEVLGTHAFDSKTIQHGNGNILEEMPEKQSDAERGACLVRMEIAEAQLLGWLISHPLLRDGNIALDNAYEAPLRRLLAEPSFEDSLRATLEAAMLGSSSAELIDILRAYDLKREHRVEIIDNALAAWTELDNDSSNGPHDRAILHFRDALKKARAELLEGNMRLVAALARQQHGRGVDFHHRLRAGFIGLSRALDRFEIERGFQLSTYATWWIKHYVRRSTANHTSPLRVPVHCFDSIRSLFYAFGNHWHPGVSKSKALRATAKELGEPIEKLQSWATLAENSVSTDRPSPSAYHSIEELLFDSVVATDLVSPQGALDEARDVLERILHDVGPKEDTPKSKRMKHARQVEIVARRLGVGLPKPDTLEVIGKDHGISRERIRQLERHAFDRLCEKHGSLAITLLKGLERDGE